MILVFLIKFVTSLIQSIAVFLQLKKMPQNLNALIRYKQIDLCLRNPYLKATIEVLQRKCSEQLGEHRGVYKLVSERTIREDIRVMRSDALGFEAPILVKDGIYTYEDPNYSIFNTAVHDLDILTTLTKLLVKEKKHLNNPVLLEMIERLMELTGIEEKVVKSKGHELADEDPLIKAIREGRVLFQSSGTFDNREEEEILFRWAELFDEL
jgi:hypothetical protein